ncbi:hypothetical protein [Ichthyobacterium seriolicida]|uniref:Pkd domain containing protein n=1 Tax=Ichthyobacterium seriolicida TaxID=242600 RepID=A0A1J1E9P7_9FLAO|nr:hypothetical protein [Ichthyobacterium seriolicida]BAV94635.1 pkd domain containing protein [Ichthyobacterium seriolicida]
MFKKNYFVKSVIFSFVLLSVIIFSCDKKKIIEDDLNICIESFSLLDSENEEKKLGSDIDCDIDVENYTISLTVPHTAVLDGLKFNIVPCEGTTISPASGEEVNFEEVVEESIEEEATNEGVDEETIKKPSTQRYKKIFTLTKDGKSQNYTVYITKALASDCSISSFKLEKTNNDGKIFADRVGDITESTDNEPSTITLHVSDAATLDGLTPTIVHTGTSFSSGELITTETADSAGTRITTTTVNYTVTAADGKTKVYVVKYIKDLSSNNRISVFSFTKDTSNNSNTGLKLTRSSTGARASDVTISSGNTNAETISVKVSTEADITNLIPTITKHENATISPDVAAHDYADSKTYTITAEDGQTKEYTVSVTKNLSNAKEISSFKFENSQNPDKNFGSNDYPSGTITSTGDNDVAVSVKIPNAVTLTGLKPSIEFSANASVNPGNEAPQNFTRGTAVDYTVTAQDGTTRRYNVTIGELSAAADIISFKILTKDHASLSSKITADMTISPTNSGSDYTIVLDGEDQTTVSLSPEIVVSPGATVDPASKAETEFTYGTAKTYTVTAENGTTKAYSVTVKSSNSKMKSFKFKTSDGTNQNTGKIVQEVEGTINDNTVTVKVPHDAVLTNLTPEVLGNNGSTVTFKTGGEANTAQDFSSQKTYTVTAQDGTTSDYNVTVTQNAAPQIETFKFTTASNNSKNLGGDITGTITHNSGTTAGEIIVKVPHDADLNGLVPTVTTNSSALANTQVYKGDSGTEVANTSTDFSNSHSTPVQYSAVGPAGGRKVYNVKVYKAPAITEFKFEQNKNTGNTDFPANKTYVGSVNETGKTITITVANTVNVASLTPTITGSNLGSTFTPTALNFTTSGASSSYSATITVQNEHLSSFTKNYTVNLTKEAAPQLTEFKITADESKGIKDEVSAEFTYPSDSSNTGIIKLKFDHKVATHHTDIDLTNLSYTSVPDTGHTLTPTSPLTDGQSIHNQTFTLTKTDTGSKSVYTVTAVKGPFIKSFKFGKDTSGNTGKNLGATDVEGVIDHANNTIKLELPKDVTMDSSGGNTITLTPTIELGGDGSPSVTSPSGTEQTFTLDSETQYTVTGADNMEKTYQVTVTKKTS